MEVKQAYGMFSDLWKFYNKFEAINKDDTVSWHKLAQEAGQIKEKYQNEFCDNLILVIVTELNKNGGKNYGRKGKENQRDCRNT